MGWFTCQRSYVDYCGPQLPLSEPLLEPRDKYSGKETDWETVDVDEVADLLLWEIMVVLQNVNAYVVDQNRNIQLLELAYLLLKKGGPGWVCVVQDKQLDLDFRVGQIQFFPGSLEFALGPGW